VEDIRRRGRFYLGNVVEKPGRREQPGRRAAILSKAEHTESS
jgi:hypothetical protein